MKITRVVISGLLLLSVTGCNLWQLGAINELRYDGKPKYIPVPPVGKVVASWTRETTCKGPMGTFAVQLTATSQSASAYSLSVRCILGPPLPGQASLILVNTHGGYSTLELGMARGSTTMSSTLDQDSLDAFPSFIISPTTSTGAPNLDPAAVNHCQLTQNESDLLWHPDQRAISGSARLLTTIQDAYGSLPAFQLAVSGSQLAVTGFPMGVATYDISHPSAPVERWRLADSLTNFSPYHPWTVFRDASKGLAIDGNFIPSGDRSYVETREPMSNTPLFWL